MKRILPLALLFVSGWVWCQSGFKLKVNGEVSAPLELSLNDLEKMPRKEASLKDKDGNVHQYRGVLVRDILTMAGVPSGKELHGEHLSICARKVR
ncbi:molybdopterin-binding protein [Chryseobacterium pennipullorum]|uniref:hypothetical protein n=1 Tax=Chryseobacterium pennipullorum TaxID=2258963 RepID=UPI001E393814|nr:hypothetical protein [Chryseobacterium pennipullorum]